MERILSNQCKDYINKKVVLFGYVHNIRKLGGLVFIILRDKSGIVQTIIEKPDEVISSLGLESVVKISGRVREEKRAPNGIEVEIEKLEPIVLVKEQIPIEINKPIEYSKVGLDKILSYRSVTLRNLQIRAIFKIQAGLAEAFRKFLNSEGFTEVFTPKIVKTATEGGAELFPVRYFEKRAYLAQSPQFYKQIMVGVFEKVFEVGYVFRAEKHETKRHLNEYVSLDVE
ncbi:aspartate--tRNA(Asn) ligase, partial [bacterium]|nr:aspartate--tRNA(Asn) ligase [bacterium]